MYRGCGGIKSSGLSQETGLWVQSLLLIDCSWVAPFPYVTSASLSFKIWCLDSSSPCYSVCIYEAQKLLPVMEVGPKWLEWKLFQAICHGWSGFSLTAIGCLYLENTLQTPTLITSYSIEESPYRVLISRNGQTEMERGSVAAFTMSHPVVPCWWSRKQSPLWGYLREVSISLGTTWPFVPPLLLPLLLPSSFSFHLVISKHSPNFAALTLCP